MPHALYSLFFNDTATTEIYTLSLHDALPISVIPMILVVMVKDMAGLADLYAIGVVGAIAANLGSSSTDRSEEHTSELQSHSDLVCRLLLEKKKKKRSNRHAQH